MTDCPDADCRVDLINKIDSKVSVKILCWGMGVILLCIGLAYGAYSKGQDRHERQIAKCNEATAELSTTTAVIESSINGIKEELKKQSRGQDRMLRILMKLDGEDHDDDWRRHDG